jgi:exosome complex component RRP42
MPSSAEIVYTLQGVADDLREDGRGRLDFRHLSLEIGLFPQANGSARLCTGGADVLVGVSAVLSVPKPSAPDLGKITISVSCGPGDAAARALPEYVAGAGVDDKRVWLEGALAQLYGRQSATGALRTLCIVPSLQCWDLQVHVQLLRSDGCPLDAAALAVRAALHDTRGPNVGVRGSSGGGAGATATAATLELELDESLDEAVPFPAASLPIYVTLATIDGHLVADCTAKERSAAGSAVSVGLDGEGHVCALRAGGGYGVHLAALASAVHAAKGLCEQLHVASRVAVDEAAARARERGGAATDAGIGMLRG